MVSWRDLPSSAWRSVVFSTVLIISLSVIASNAVSILLLDTLSHGINGPGIVAATIIPIILGGPMMFYQTLRHQQFKLMNQQLEILASTDSLTECLNRRAFTAHAGRMLDPAGKGGTLLVIDADHFKLINDRFGHEAGDKALQMLAQALRSAVRQTDLVGRLGGEEFGVFLHEADYDTAAVIAERIRRNIRDLKFAPDGEPHELSVSIGGATAVGLSRFAELFRVADQQLYDAKSAGRDRIEIVRMPPSIDAPANVNRRGPIDKTAMISL